MREQIIKVVRDDGVVFTLGDRIANDLAQVAPGEPPYTVVFIWTEYGRIVRVEQNEIDEDGDGLITHTATEFPSVIRVGARQLGRDNVPLPGRAVIVFDIEHWRLVVRAAPPTDFEQFMEDWAKEQEAEIEIADEKQPQPDTPTKQDGEEQIQQPGDASPS